MVAYLLVVQIVMMRLPALHPSSASHASVRDLFPVSAVSTLLAVSLPHVIHQTSRLPSY